MSNELIVLSSFCKDREMFEKYHAYMQSINNMDRELKLLLKLVADYYAEYEASSINADELKVFFDNQYPAQRDRNLFLGVIGELFTKEINDDLLLDTIQNVMERHYAAHIIAALMPVLDGEVFGVLPTLGEQIDEYIGHMRNPPGLAELEACSKPLAVLLQETSQADGLSWPLPFLDTLIGPVIAKTIGLIYAFVDSGKTSLAMRTLAHWASQLEEGENLVFAGNEEAAERTRLRLASTLAEVPRTSLEREPHVFENVIFERGFEQVRIYDSVSSLATLETIIKRESPRAVVIDQATKLDASKNLESVAELRLLFNKLRELAKQHNTAILGVAQGVGDAENKKWLKLSDIYGSRVAIQGDLDYAIGVGRLVDDPTKENIRYFNIPKNKMLNGDTGRHTVVFDKYANVWKEA